MFERTDKLPPTLTIHAKTVIQPMQVQYGGNSTTAFVFYLALTPKTQELFAQSEPTIYIEHLQSDPYITLVSISDLHDFEGLWASSLH